MVQVASGILTSYGMMPPCANFWAGSVEQTTRNKIDSLNEKGIINEAKLDMKSMQLHSVLYIISAIAIYVLYWFFIRKRILNEWFDFSVQTIYWGITCVLMNFINHGKIWIGIKSFFKPNSVLKKIIEDKSKLPL